MINGSVDALDSHLISGWAYDVSHPDQRVTVSVHLGDRLLFEASADLWREDLAQGGIGDGRHSFFHAFPERIDETRLRDISVSVAKQKLPINASAPAETRPSDAHIVGSFERLDRSGVAGWAYNKAAPDHPVLLSVFLGPRLLHRLNADVPRPDLEAAKIGDGRHGFLYAFSEDIAEAELSQISVRAGAVELMRAEELEPFFGAAPDGQSPIDASRALATVVPVRLRNVFEIGADSVLGRLARLPYRNAAPDAATLNPILYDVSAAIRSGDSAKLHLETMSVDLGDRIAQIQVSRTNTQFSAVDRAIGEFRYGCEPEILALIDFLVPNDGVFLDIGANWGCFSIYLAARKGFAGKAYAFEPSSASFRDLTKAIRDLNLTERVIANGIGLGDYAGSAQLAVGLISGLSSFGDFVADNFAVSREEAAMARLDDLELPPASLIKIDVEGYEANVIRGGERYIREAKPAIVLESWLSPDQPEKSLEPLAILTNWGYQLYYLSWTNEDRTRYSPAPLGADGSYRLALCPVRLSERPLLEERLNILAVRQEIGGADENRTHE